MAPFRRAETGGARASHCGSDPKGNACGSCYRTMRDSTSSSNAGCLPIWSAGKAENRFKPIFSAFSIERAGLLRQSHP